MEVPLQIDDGSIPYRTGRIVFEPMEDSHEGTTLTAVVRVTFPTFLYCANIRVRFHIFGNTRIEIVVKYQLCMVFKLRIIWKRPELYIYD